MSESTETEVVDENPDIVSESPEEVETGSVEGRARSIKHRRGKVVSTKMQGTVIVMVERKIRHRRYNKYVNQRRRFSVDDKVSCEVGDLVIIRETRPLSKTKRWEVVRKIGHQD
ncbi:MAG TPA: 30S ribosomal protein S17 [Myxococcales bacterium LLY-WYZ-16_1]|nr:30S ribosomal protein S17 [Myxococcales bacterium LLY-WYZ-16_1]